MRRIIKHELSLVGVTELEFEFDAVFLDCGFQPSTEKSPPHTVQHTVTIPALKGPPTLVAWFSVATDASQTKLRRFHVFMTGERVPYEISTYLGSAAWYGTGGPYVVHVYLEGHPA